MNSFFFFFFIQNGAVWIKIGNFAEFQFSPPTFNFVRYYSLIDPETSDLMQFSPGVTSSSAPELRAFCNMVLGLGFMQFRP